VTGTTRSEITERSTSSSRQRFNSFHQLPRSLVSSIIFLSVSLRLELNTEGLTDSPPTRRVNAANSHCKIRSHDLATEKNTKTITAAHVLEATKQLGWEDGGKELERYLKKELKGERRSRSTFVSIRCSCDKVA
jgi:hypothetical protein